VLSPPAFASSTWPTYHATPDRQGADTNYHWAALGWEAGPLGYPVSDEYAIPGGRRSNFVFNVISWNAATGVALVGG